MRLPIALAALLALAPLALASGLVPPEDAERIALGERTLAHHVGANAQERNATVQPGGAYVLAFHVTKGNVTTNASVVLNVSAPSFGVPNATLTIALPEEPVPVTDTWRATTLDLVVPADATGNLTYTFEVTAYENGTLVATSFGGGSVAVAVVEAPAPPGGLPGSWLVAGGAVLVVGGGAAVLAARRAATRRRMNEGPRRSQVMREIELEKKLEKAKDPEQVAQIQQEIRSQETVRERRREVQILEARRADALKTMDLLRKRHESGGLTKLQFDNMMAKKQADLARIEGEIAAMEREDSGAAA